MKVGCNAEADIRDVSQSSPLGNFSIEHANESVCDNTLTIEEETTTKAGCYEITKPLGKVRSSEINTHSRCKGCKKNLSITYRKRNIVSRKISPYSCQLFNIAAHCIKYCKQFTTKKEIQI